MEFLSIAGGIVSFDTFCSVRPQKGLLYYRYGYDQLVIACIPASFSKSQGSKVTCILFNKLQQIRSVHSQQQPYRPAIEETLLRSDRVKRDEKSFNTQTIPQSIPQYISLLIELLISAVLSKFHKKKICLEQIESIFSTVDDQVERSTLYDRLS